MTRYKVEYFAIGAISGMIVGIVVGLLVAPASGDRTRRRLVAEARRAANAAKAVAERAEEAAEILSGRVEHYLGRDEEAAWRKVREIKEGVQRYTRAQTVQ
ncbi:MAG: YtxH domain-containing protein [Clostridiales bacterium]|nr:YtxH domain-containing protein [Clostridiales bacterium]